MSQFNSLLVAVDFKKSSQEFSHQACLIARQLGTEVTLLYVMEGQPYNPYYQENTLTPLDDWLEKTRVKLDEVKTMFNSEGIAVNEHIIKEGKPWKLICETAKEINACGIVLGVGDHYFLEDIVGTTADKVTKYAEPPVIVINHESHHEGLKKIMCAVDFSENSNKALENAVVIARDMEAHLDVVHVIHDYYADYYLNPFNPGLCTMDTDTEKEKVSQKVEELLEEKKEKMHAPGVGSKVHVVHGSTGLEITRLVEELNSDLLVVGACGHSAIMKFFLGNVTEKLLRKAPCSIMVIKNHED